MFCFKPVCFGQVFSLNECLVITGISSGFSIVLTSKSNKIASISKVFIKKPAQLMDRSRLLKATKNPAFQRGFISILNTNISILVSIVFRFKRSANFNANISRLVFSQGFQFNA